MVKPPPMTGLLWVRAPMVKMIFPMFFAEHGVFFYGLDNNSWLCYPCWTRHKEDGAMLITCTKCKVQHDSRDVNNGICIWCEQKENAENRATQLRAYKCIKKHTNS